MQAINQGVIVWTSVQERRWRKERQIFVLLSLLFIALIVCWMPWFVYSALSTYYSTNDWLAYMVTYWLGYGLSMVNPFLFNIVNPNMRRTVKRLFTGKHGVGVGPAMGSSKHESTEGMARANNQLHNRIAVPVQSRQFSAP